MTPIMQTVTHSNHARGNCLRASLASLLSIAIDAIPAFENMPKNQWRENLARWLQMQGYQLTTHAGLLCEKGYYLAVGLSDRGIRHCVIYQGDQLAHDPHPSQSGLLQVDESWVIKRTATLH